VPTRKGESIAQLHDRAAAAVEAIIDAADREGHRAILLCSHAATIIALGRVLTGYMPDNIETEDFRVFTCGLSVFKRRKGSDNSLCEVKSAGSGDDRLQHRRSCNEQGEEGIQVKPQGGRAGDSTVPGKGTTASNSESTLRKVDWRNGQGVRGGWNCLTNGDCSFLSGGEERGW